MNKRSVKKIIKIISYSLVLSLSLTACSSNDVETKTPSGNDQVGNDQVLTLIEPVKLEEVKESREIPVELWEEDIDLLSSELKKIHKNLYSNISENTFDAEVELLKNRLTRLSNNEV